MKGAEDDQHAAETRMQNLLQSRPQAIRARYDRHGARIVIRLDTGLDILLPVRMAQGLNDASADDLREIEISPTGLGLHWPRLDADLYVPGLRGSDEFSCLDGCQSQRRGQRAQA